MVGFLIAGTIKLFIWLIRLSIFLCVAVVVLLGALIADATGHQQASRQWMRAMPRLPWP